MIISLPSHGSYSSLWHLATSPLHPFLTTGLISLPSHGSYSSFWHLAISPLHPFLTTGLSTWGCFPPHPVSLLGHTFSFRLAQTSFDPCLYLYKYLAISSPLFFLFIWPLKMERTECTETLAHKIQMPGITQKKEYNLFFIIGLVHPLFFIYYLLLIC